LVGEFRPQIRPLPALPSQNGFRDGNCASAQHIFQSGSSRTISRSSTSAPRGARRCPAFSWSSSRQPGVARQRPGSRSRAPRSRAWRRARVRTSRARGRRGRTGGGVQELFMWAEGATARRRRRRVLRLRRGRRARSRFGGIPSFSAAASESASSAASAVATVSARRRVAIRVLGHSDHAGGVGRELRARHWPHSRQIVVPLAGSGAGQRIDGMLPRPSALRTCSVSFAQPRQ
jgi:hypothetical protein